MTTIYTTYHNFVDRQDERILIFHLQKSGNMMDWMWVCSSIPVGNYLCNRTNIHLFSTSHNNFRCHNQCTMRLLKYAQYYVLMRKGFFYLQLTFFQFMISVYPTTHPTKENTNKFQIRVKYICLYTVLPLFDHKMCTLQNSADVVQCLVVLGKQPWMTSVSRDQKTPKP